MAGCWLSKRGGGVTQGSSSSSKDFKALECSGLSRTNERRSERARRRGWQADVDGKACFACRQQAGCIVAGAPPARQNATASGPRGNTVHHLDRGREGNSSVAGPTGHRATTALPGGQQAGRRRDEDTKYEDLRRVREGAAQGVLQREAVETQEEHTKMQGLRGSGE